MKKRKLRLLLISTLVIALLMTSVTVSFGASKSKKMTAYDDVVKKGNYAYCSTNAGVYKVNLTTREAKRIVKAKYKGEGKVLMMKIHKGYLYYVDYGAISGALYRVKTNGKSKKYLANMWDYAISKNKIYYVGVKEIRGGEDYKGVYRKMNTNGKSKSASPYKVHTVRKDSNSKGYRLAQEEIVLNEDDYYVIEYLVLPSNERIKLCSYSW